MSTLAVPTANLFLRTERPVLPAITQTPILRVRADQGLELATGVKTWRDISGSGNHPVQATGANQPTIVASATNGCPALLFDGSNDYLQVAFTLNQPFTVFFVHKSVALGVGGSNDWLWSGAANDCGVEADNAPRYLINGGNGTPIVASALANGSFAYTTTVMNGASSLIRVNGSQTAAGDTGANAAGGITIGARFTGLRNTNIQVAEMIVYAASVSAADQLLVEAYLKTRYGL